MKPHEETWKRKGNDVVTSPRGRVLTVVRLYPNDDASLDLAAAAPEMARALLGLLDPDTMHRPECSNRNNRTRACMPDCGAIREALTAAGVLP